MDASSTDANLYPTCPSTAGTGTVNGDPEFVSATSADVRPAPGGQVRGRGSSA